MSHTLGPWKIRADLAITAYDTETEEHQPIARAFGNGSCETLFANTRLIAAAPDLLAALEKLLKQVSGQLDTSFNHQGLQNLDAIVAARAALAKATGKA